MTPFPWRRGMTMLRGNGRDIVLDVVTAADGTVRLCWHPDGLGSPSNGDLMPPPPYADWGWVCASEVEPVRDDPSTVGALLAAVRDARGEPRGFVLPPGALCSGWVYVANADTSPLRASGDGYPTEFAALMAAWGMT